MGKVRTQYGYWHRRRRSIGCELDGGLGYWIVELDGDPGHGQTRIFALPAREQMKTLEVGHLCLFMCALAGCLSFIWVPDVLYSFWRKFVVAREGNLFVNFSG